MSYYLHRIQISKDSVQKGIEVHDTLDAALLSYWGRVKTGYGKSEYYFVSCKITDDNGNVVKEMAWLDNGELPENKFFLHHIRKDGDDTDKAIDVLDSVDTAKGNFAEQMEYGYNNSKHPDVSYVSCMITDLLSGGLVLMKETWAKPSLEPTPEPETTEE